MSKNSVVKIKGGKLHINNEPKEYEFRYVWEEEGEFWVSKDGENWMTTVVFKNNDNEIEGDPYEPTPASEEEIRNGGYRKR